MTRTTVDELALGTIERTRPLGAHHVPDEAVPWLRRVARLWGALAFLGWLLWRLDAGVPRTGEQGAWEVRVELALWFLAVVGYVLALEWEIAGATVMASAGAGLALWMSEHHSATAGIVALVLFFVPAAIYWVVWQRYRPNWELITLGILLGALLAGGTVGAVVVDDAIRGPTHPPSVVSPLPDSPVAWVWSGGVTSTAAQVRARIDGEPTEARLAVATTPDLDDPQWVAGVPASPDDPGLVAFSVERLEPDTEYHYAIEVDGVLDTERAGTFATFGDGRWDFRLAVASCARTGSNGAVFDAMRRLEPDLFVMTGDLHYGDIAVNDRERFRDHYDAVFAEPGPAAFYRSVPVDYVWDDHDFGPNDADSTADSRPAAQTVYREVVPHYPLARDGQQPIHHAFTIGRARVIVTDLRSARSPKDDPDGPAKAMMGQDQLQWFLDELRAANDEYPLIIWVSSVPWITAAEAGADHWGGYAYERNVIADFIAEHRIDGLVMLAGDAHMIAIDDGTHSDFSSGGTGDGFPVLQAAALDRPGSAKGGPYSHGVFPGGGRFGMVDVHDRGVEIDVTLSGHTWDGLLLTSYTFTVDAPPEAGTEAGR